MKVGGWRKSEVWPEACLISFGCWQEEEVGKAEAIGRSAEVRKFSVGKRRAVCTRGGKAMDGRKRAGSTALGRAASKPAKGGFANRRTSFMIMSFMAGGIAARAQTSG